MTMIHFVHFTSRPGGIEVLLPEIIDHMPAHAFQAFVIRPPAEGQGNVYEGKDVAVTYGAAQNLLAFRRLWAYARKHRSDIFHVFNIGPFNLLVLRLAGVKKLIYSIHGTIYWQNSLQKWLRRPAWLAAEIPGMAITANSLYSRKVFLREVYPHAEVQLLYNPINTDRYRIAASGAVSANDTVHVVYAGRLTQGKNLHRWLSIAAELAGLDSRYRFTLYGDGPVRPALEAHAAQLGLNGQLRFAGHVRDVAEAYRSADLLMFLSEYESFGNVVVESILCGTPVLASAIPSMQEIFAEYPEFLVPADASMEQAVIQQIKALPELKSLAARAAENFREKFSLNRFVHDLNTIYERFPS